MSRGFLITANASEMSGAEFFRAIFGKAPPTEAEIAERKAAAEAFWAKRKAEHEESTRLMRQRVAEIIAADRARREQLTEVEHLGPGRIAA